MILWISLVLVWVGSSQRSPHPRGCPTFMASNEFHFGSISGVLVCNAHAEAPLSDVSYPSTTWRLFGEEVVAGFAHESNFTFTQASSTAPVMGFTLSKSTFLDCAELALPQENQTISIFVSRSVVQQRGVRSLALESHLHVPSRAVPTWYYIIHHLHAHFAWSEIDPHKMMLIQMSYYGGGFGWGGRGRYGGYNITTTQTPGTIYSAQFLSFYCYTPEYYFSDGIQWAIKWKYTTLCKSRVKFIPNFIPLNTPSSLTSGPSHLA